MSRTYRILFFQLALSLCLTRYGSAVTPIGSITITGADQSSGAVWDSGAVTATVNGVSVSVPYGQFSTPVSIAAALGAQISQDCNMPVYAMASGTTLNFYQKGTNTISSAVIVSESSNPPVFLSNSFLVNGSSAASPLESLVYFGPGLGALTYNASTAQNQCWISWNQNYSTPENYEELFYTNFTYVPDISTGLASVPISGGLSYISGSMGPGYGISDSCPSNGPVAAGPIVYTDTTSNNGGTSPYQIAIDDPNGAFSAGFYQSGYINPKWEVIGVLYAPPGALNSGGNNVDYTNSSLVSVTNSIDKTWSKDSTVASSLTESGDLNIFGFKLGSVTYTQGTSKSFTQGTEDNTSTTVSKMTAISLKMLPGPSGYAGIDHDWDVLLVWVNPVTLVNLGSGGVSSWSGYGFNSSDSRAPGDMEIAKVNLGCLTGHWNVTSFPPGLGPSTLAQSIQQFCGEQTFGYFVNGTFQPGPFLRSWASSQTFDSPDTPPTNPPQGYSNASLSPVEDFQSIVQMDPWYNCTNESPHPNPGEDWTTDGSGNLLCPSPNPIDNGQDPAGAVEPNFQALQAEFTPVPTNGPVPYAQGSNWTGTIEYQTMNGQSTNKGKDTTRSFGWEYGMKVDASGHLLIFDLGITASVTRSGKETTTVKSNKQMTNTTTSTISATLGPPPNPGADGCPSTPYPPGVAYTNYPLQFPDCGVPILGDGPAWGQMTSYNVYEDNYFGSFLFSPVYY